MLHQPINKETMETALFHSGWIDEDWYRERYSLSASVENVSAYYWEKGWQLQHDPSPEFSAAYCYQNYPDICPKDQCPLCWFLETNNEENRWTSNGQEERLRMLEQTPLFDWDWYYDRWLRGKCEGRNARLHYLQQGANLNFDPSPLFKAEIYKKNWLCRGVVLEIPALVHFLTDGFQRPRLYMDLQDEGYQALKHSGQVDIRWYQETYLQNRPEIDAVWYYLKIGAFKGQQPNPLFTDSEFYAFYPSRKTDHRLPMLQWIAMHPHQLGRLPEWLSEREAMLRPEGARFLTPDNQKKQDAAIKVEYDENAEKLIIFLLPDYSHVNGGVQSIVSMARESALLSEVQPCPVLLATVPSPWTFFQYYSFECDAHIFRFEQLPSQFKKLKQLLLHIPEVYAQEFAARLTKREEKWLQGIAQLQINIMNQNMQLMPAPAELKTLYTLTEHITQTVAHAPYCTKEMQEKYQMPIHQLIAFWPVKWEFSTYEEKENLLVYSNDFHPMKARVLQKIRDAFPDMELFEINNITLEEYKKLIARAKWCLTFGEGLDGYFIQPLYSGSVSFAVYNDTFFTPHYKGLRNVFLNYEEMTSFIAERMHKCDSPQEYEKVRQEALTEVNKDYCMDVHVEQLRQFYLGHYTFQ